MGSGMITASRIEEAEKQICDLRREIDYDTKDYAVDFLIDRFHENDFFIPDEYQRKFIWERENKSLFIESVLLGLPIPFMFFADTDDGRCEIIDGAQRTQTLEEFLAGDMRLGGLKRLSSLNGFAFHDLPELYRRKFSKTTLRIVVLSEDTTIETRQEIFNRINTAGRKATSIEVRRGAYRGPFMDFIAECADDSLFQKLCPVSDRQKARYENQELVIRFFAYRYRYKMFKHNVDGFLDEFVEQMNVEFNREPLERLFQDMLRFVDKFFPYGFRKTESANVTPRVRFEALSVGVSLALEENPALIPESMEWIDGEDFKAHTTTHASNSPVRLAGRIEYVRDALLGDL